MIDYKKAVKDIYFCKELMDRLVIDVETMPKTNFYNNHTVIQADIKRLRRELMKASKVFEEV